MFCRLVSQVLINLWAYVFTRPESLGVKGQEPDFVYVIMQIINKIYKLLCPYQPQRKNDGGLSFHKVG
jgi:hypothetical protein